MHTYFVTGTDTDAGKTVATVLLLQTLNKMNLKSLGIKPIAAGCERTSQGLRNQDALLLQAASGVKADYSLINPIAYEESIAPHIAAALHLETIELSALQSCLDKAQALNPACLLIEGAGGWRLPLDNNGLFLSDFARQNQMRVILVVGMKLGCLNHAILTHQAILADGLECVGWIANQLSKDMPFYAQNIETLQAVLPCPQLAEIPFQANGVNDIITYASFLEVFR